MTPSASVLKPSIVRFLYRLRLCSKMCSLFPSLFKKCGYWRQKVSSRGVSNNPLCGRISSLERNVRLLDCIFTAIDIEARSEPNGLKTTSLVNVSEQSLGMQFEGVLSTQVA
jgi:hypothetical protein